jgi:hypothetical protein
VGGGTISHETSRQYIIILPADGRDITAKAGG